MEMILIGEPISADEAQRLNIINGIIKKDTLLSEVQKIAEKMSNKSWVPLA